MGCNFSTKAMDLAMQSQPLSKWNPFVSTELLKSVLFTGENLRDFCELLGGGDMPSEPCHLQSALTTTRPWAGQKQPLPTGEGMGEGGGVAPCWV